MIQMLENPWAVCEEDFPWDGMPADRLKFLLNYAVLAPSGYNTQPWLFKVTGTEVALYADRTRTLPVSDPDNRELIMSCGAALFHLRTALRHYGFEPIVRTFPNLDEPDLLAYVRIGPPRAPTLSEHRLFMAIKKRRTSRLPFRDEAIDARRLQKLEAAAEMEGARLHVFQQGAGRAVLEALIAESDRLQHTDRRFRRELATWIHANGNRRQDGMPGYTHGMGDLLSYAGPLLMRRLDWDRQGTKIRELAAAAPVLAVLSTQSNTPPAWLAAGQAIGRVLLQACDYGLSGSFFNQPVEVAALRPQVADLVGSRLHPQLVLRLGVAQETRMTPRRPVHEVLAKR